MFDLRSNPEANKGLSRAMFFLWRGLEERLMEQGVEFIFGLIKEDNSRSTVSPSEWAPRPAVRDGSSRS